MFSTDIKSHSPKTNRHKAMPSFGIMGLLWIKSIASCGTMEVLWVKAMPSWGTFEGKPDAAEGLAR